MLFLQQSILQAEQSDKMIVFELGELNMHPFNPVLKGFIVNMRVGSRRGRYIGLWCDVHMCSPLLICGGDPKIAHSKMGEASPTVRDVSQLPCAAPRSCL